MRLLTELQFCPTSSQISPENNVFGAFSSKKAIFVGVYPRFSFIYLYAKVHLYGEF